MVGHSLAITSNVIPLKLHLSPQSDQPTGRDVPHRNPFPFAISLAAWKLGQERTCSTFARVGHLNLERIVQNDISRRFADYYVEGTWNYLPMHITIQQHQVIGRKPHRHGFCFAGI